MNRFLFLLILLAISCQDQPKKPLATSKDAPNVLLIMTDDQGYGDFGFTGNAYLQTPHLDQLASESTWLTNFYVSPVCAPTRASLMTGKFALRTGIYDTFNGGAMMAGEETTLAEVLQASGYQTGIFGKWHLGDTYPFRPSDQGFEESLIHHGGGIGQFGDPTNYYRQADCYFNPTLFHNNEQVSSEGYCSDVFTDATLDFIQQDRTTPFFAYLAFNAPHDPLQVPEKWYNKYKDLRFDSTEAARLGMKIPAMNAWEKENARRVYGMVSNIDHNIGRILEALETQGILENTVIFFLSDNGPMSKRYNGGLRALKGNTYDGGVKSPCLIRYPKRFSKGAKIEAVTAHIDLLPTIASLCEARIPHPQGIDGKNILPLLEGKTEKDFSSRNLYEQWGRMFPERYQNISIRKGNYKLLAKAGYLAPLSAFELYNTREDPGEQDNLVETQPQLAQQLKDELDTWFEQEVVVAGNPKPVYMILDPVHEDTLVLTRNDAKGPPEIWGNDFQYGYWDIEVAQAGRYGVSIYFRDNAKKKGRIFVKQPPLQYSLENTDTTAKVIAMESVYLKEGTGKLEVLYKTGWNEVMLPLVVKVYKEN